MDYVVLRCHDAVEFAKWGHASYGVWIPTERKVTTIRGKAYTRYVAAFPGYAFIPRTFWSECRRRCPIKYSVRVLGYDLAGRPRTVPLSALAQMQSILNKHAEDKRSEPPVKPERALSAGDPILIAGAAMFDGMTGAFIKYKGDSRCRVRLDDTKVPYVDIPLTFIRPG